MRRTSILAVALTAACYPTTTRPDLVPLLEAPRLEVELEVPQATRALALALDADSFPVRRTEPVDGWLETGWFNSVSLQPTADRPLGINVVRVRGFVEPGRANHSVVTLEAVYRPIANPAMPERELEQVVPEWHPVAGRLRRVLETLRELYGEPAPGS
jgi:hypothetical protein